MSKNNARRERQLQRLDQRRRSSRVFAFTVGGIAAAVLVAVLAASSGRWESSGTPPVTGVERIGRASALGLEADARTVALGHVPLSTTVEPSWNLVNHSSSAVTIGKPHAEVIEGCCPGPLQLGTSRLQPGEATELVFPLQMHAGMDGPHDFAVHVPVTQNGEKAILELRATGHFSA